MFAQLPEPIQEQVIRYLEANDFPAAKKLHDDWFRKNSELATKKVEVSRSKEAPIETH
jgi:hypothetical protein